MQADRPIPLSPAAGRSPVEALGALGVVFGDLGTNVLFTIRAALTAHPGRAPAPDEILGIASLISWALVLVISIKYLLVIMRADNRGEGGILALLALLRLPADGSRTRRRVLVGIGLVGAALVYGDGVVTPAISVLAAVEGLEAEQPSLEPFVVPISALILLFLFFLQHRGTGRIGALFGPVMLLWFLMIAALGIGGIVREPGVLAALSPTHAVHFLLSNGSAGFLTLGVIVLAVAGAEALYADMGHFGARPIRLAWYLIVFPALLLNYLGQAALVMRQTAPQENTFFALVPPALHYPAVLLAICATVIASQALISGAFSLTRQAVQLGYLPRMPIRFTSARMPGQVYLPVVNFALMLLCLMLVLVFRNSQNLSSAYGMAVAGAMASTSLLFFFVARDSWGWGWFRAGVVSAAFLTIDLAFLGATLVKFFTGAWIPLLIAGLVVLLMATWSSGIGRLESLLKPEPISAFLERLRSDPPVRAAGTGIFVATEGGGIPRAISHFLDRAHLLPQNIVLLLINTTSFPRIAEEERIEIERLPDGLLLIRADYGFMETPNLPRLLARAREKLPRLSPAPTYYLSLATLLVTEQHGIRRFRDAFFDFLWRNAQPAWIHFGIPAGQVIEIGVEIEL